jgi:hypothetical protein
MNEPAYDFIGDTHGQFAKLESLLETLGYGATGGDSSAHQYRAPFSTILHGFAPVSFKGGVVKYLSDPLFVSGERRLTESEARSLVIACAYIGIEAAAIERQFDRDRVLTNLTESVRALDILTIEERHRALQLVQRFYDYKIIRAERAFEDRLCEALWSEFQSVPYVYPSTMARLVGYGLGIMNSLEQCTLEYDPVGEERVFKFDIRHEIDRYFDDSSLAREEAPRIVLIAGGPAAGKTWFRKEKFARGYVVVDAAEIFLSLSRGEFFPFPGPFWEPLDLVGGLVARRAIRERRHIVTELIGAEYEPLEQLIEAMLAIGYAVSGTHITSPLDLAMQRNLDRANDNISAYYTESFQRRWLVEAASDALNPGNDDA